MFNQLFTSKQLDFKNNAFDFVRLFLALAVVVSHVNLVGGFGYEPNFTIKDFKFFYDHITIGGFAVYCFFVISGFLISASWEHSDSWSSFLKKRFVRIFPGYWVALTIISLVFLPSIYFLTGGPTAGFLSKLFLDFIPYSIKNFFFDIKVWTIPDFLTANPSSVINGTVWTIRYELYAYFLVIALGLLGLLKNKTKLLVIFGLFWIFYIFASYGNSFLFDVNQMFGDVWWIILDAYFLAGVVIYAFREKIIWNKFTFIFSLLVFVVACLFGFFPVVGPICLSFMVIYACFSLPIRSFAKKYGDFSYGVYIYSWPIQQLLVVFGVHKFGGIVYGFLSVFFSLLAGYLSWHLVEKRFLLKKSSMKIQG